VSGTDESADVAVGLANTFASEFTEFTRERATENINEALASLQRRIRQLAARGQRDTPEYDTLIEQSGQLATVGRLLAGNTSVLRPADGAEKTQPRPTRSAILAALFGVVLGVALAFLAEALDRYVRSEHEIDEALQHPLLGRIPKPSRRLRKANALVMLEDPRSVYAETFRKLRASLEFVNPDRSATTIMVTSAVAQEGKSTTIANLAVALARSGRRIALVDLDLRAPFLGRLFRESTRPGITDVAVGRATLEQAMRPIALAKASRAENLDANGRRTASGGNGAAPVGGVLHLLPAGTLPPSADEMLQDPRLLSIIDELATEFDAVLIDAPPLLAFGDAMTLSTKADAMIAIARLGRLQRPILHEFARQLHACKADVLGYVVTGVEHSDSYRYMYQGYVYDTRVREAKARDSV
jgi:non-specific protein-tyrosine kinase